MKILMITLLVFTGLSVHAQNIRGKIITQSDSLPVANASIELKSLGKKTTTNGLGEFKFDVPVGKYLISITHIGFETNN